MAVSLIDSTHSLQYLTNLLNVLEEISVSKKPVVLDKDGLDPNRWRTLFVVAIAQLMVVLDSSIVNIAIPSAKADLGITDANQQWVITAYTLAFGSLLLLGGRIGDFMGRKKIFIIGLLGFAGASALGGIASTQGLLFASRALQGVFGALLAPAALAIISVTFTVPAVDESELPEPPIVDVPFVTAIARPETVADDGATERTPRPNAATATSAMRLNVVFVDICFLSIVDLRNFRRSAWN